MPMRPEKKDLRRTIFHLDNTFLLAFTWFYLPQPLLTKEGKAPIVVSRILMFDEREGVTTTSWSVFGSSDDRLDTVRFWRELS
jgi:hypothetical protein